MENLLIAANWIGSALCHQWDSHSYIIDGVPLCLCARCTGMYVGALLTLIFLAVRIKGIAQMPRPPYLVAFMVFFGLWAGDGVNSYATTLRGAPFLYQPQNVIRLTTGMFMGIALGSLTFVILNMLLQPIPNDRKIPSLYARVSDFLILVVLSLIAVGVIASQWDWLLYPLTAILLVAMVTIPAAFTVGIMSSLAVQPMQPSVIRRIILAAIVLSVLVLSAMALGRSVMNLPPEPLI